MYITCYQVTFDIYIYFHRKNDFVKGSKMLLDTDPKIILFSHQNNFIETLKIMSNVTQNFAY